MRFSGAVLCPLNTSLRTDDLSHILANFRATVIVTQSTSGDYYYLATLAENSNIETIEGKGEPDAVQHAFVESSAFQCGFCTPGFVLMTRQLLDEHPDPDEDAIRHYLSGNLCRCAAYPEIIEAVKLAARKRRKS